MTLTILLFYEVETSDNFERCAFSRKLFDNESTPEFRNSSTAYRALSMSRDADLTLHN